MLFNSIEFLVFLVVVLLVYHGSIPARFEVARKAFLLAASYLFYMAWNPPFVLLLLASTLLDFTVAQRMSRASGTARRRLLLALSLAGNLGLLCYFKYGNFVTENFYRLFGEWLGASAPPALDIILPIGISFYTFQTLSYSIDVYRGDQEPTRSLLDFALYVSFFPQLIAGPIVRSRDFLPQLVKRDRTHAVDVEVGLARIATGLLKKVVLADTLGSYVDPVFANPAGFPALNLVLATYAYAYQIYFDFSGYSDMAIGLGRLFGFRIPENFDRPYRAANVREFWRRWHISLSTWLRDYLYVSLGGNRQGTVAVYMSLAVTMLLGGLWHGASWTFVVWGAYHGVLLIAHRAAFGAMREDAKRTPLWLRQIVTFHLVCLGWIVFRAQTLGEAVTFVAGFGEAGFVASPLAIQAMVLLALSAGIHVVSESGRLRDRFAVRSAWVQGVGYAAIALLVFLFSPATERFIYFQF